MYEQLLQAKIRPFRATPDSKFYYAHESIEAARQTAVRALVRAEGPVMVLGGAGLGKSLLGQLVADDTLGRFDIVHLHAARLCSRQALLQSILFELQMPYRDLSEGELRLSILDRLEPSPELPPEGLLFIVDEAHTLPPKLLDELRLINNFTRESQPRTRLLLLGSLRLEDIFAQPQMDSFNQRLAARCYLQSMSRHDTHNYVRHQLSIVGVDANKFITVDALDAVHSACEGLPRLTNQIMDHAIVLASETRQSPISSSLIQEAWAELQQLPAPWHVGEQPRQGSSTESAAIEFGSLDDDDDASDLDPLPLASHDAASPQPVVGDAKVDTAEVAESLARVEEAPNFFAAFELSTDEALPVFDVEQADQSNQSAASESAAQLCSPIADSPIADSPIADSPVVGIHEAVVLESATDAPQVLFDASLAFPSLNLSPSQQSFIQSSLSSQAKVDQSNVESAEDAQAASELRESGWDAAIEENPAVGSTYNFFTNQQTDERLLAFADEQDQYDSMGVWENDPPIGRPVSASGAIKSEGVQSQGFEVVEPELIQFDLLKETAPQLRSSSNVFGDDFEEEFAITADGASMVQKNKIANPALEFSEAESHFERKSEATYDVVPSQDVAAVAAAYIDELQQFASNVTSRSSEFGEQISVEQILADLDQTCLPANLTAEGLGDDPADPSSQDAWRVAAHAIDVNQELAVHDELEDIVSQLNFSAFSVEPFSVEQIEVAGETLPNHGVKRGGQEQVYLLHHAQQLPEESITTQVAEYDDDRDLLIIEEEVPACSKTTEPAAQEKPSSKPASYSQLFAKLRR